MAYARPRRLPEALFLFACAAALVSSGCLYKPQGECKTHVDCSSGRHCSSGICVADRRGLDIGEACAVDRECVAWADCVEGICMLSAGACATASDCRAWETCAESNSCTLAPNRCYAESDCPNWKTCDGDHACALAAGRCDGAGDCPAWQYCDAAHACVDIGTSCTVGGTECEAWEECASGHCINQAGRCSSTGHCDPLWQVCDLQTHACVAGPGKCETTADCGGIDRCTATHDCVPADECSASEPCPSSLVCVGGHCVPDSSFQIAASRIYIWGSVKGGDCEHDAISPLDSPSTIKVGFDCWVGNFDGNNVITPQGDLLYTTNYLDTSLRDLRRFVDDSFTWDAEARRSEYPANPSSNDPSPASCTSASLMSFVIQAGSGEVMYRCDGGAWKSTSGQELVSAEYQVHAWNSEGTKLVTSPPALIDGSNTHTLITGLPAPSLTTMEAFRVAGSGFWIAVYDLDTRLVSLWEVAPSGAAIRRGTYPPLPSHWSPEVIDSEGSIYGIRAFGTVDKCALGATACSVVYDEANGPTDDWTVFSPRLYNRLYSARLITGP